MGALITLQQHPEVLVSNFGVSMLYVLQNKQWLLFVECRDNFHYFVCVLLLRYVLWPKWMTFIIRLAFCSLLV